MIAQAKFKYVRVPSQKIRPVLNMVRGENAQKALDLLTFCDKKSAPIIKKLIKSAIANANSHGGVDVDNLYVSKAYAGQGPTLKRWRAKARGMAGRVNRRTSHITVELDEK